MLLNQTTAYFISFYFISFRFVSFRFVSFHFISFHFISFHFTSLHFTSLHFISLHFISFHFISFYFLIAHVELMRTSWNKWLDCSWLKSKIEGSLMAEKTHKTLKIMLCVSFSYWILRNIIVHTSYIFMLALSHFYSKALYCC